MKTTWPVVLGFATALAFSAIAKTNAPGTFVLKGTVVDAAGRPLEGASVESITFGGARFGSSDPTVAERTVAGAGGTFELPLPRTGAYLLARKPGFAPVWRQFRNVQDDTELRLVLTPPGFLAGTVVDEADQPVAGAEVFVVMAFSLTQEEGGRQTYNHLSGQTARDLFSARTGADGRFRIEGFPTNASANLTVKAAGKAPHGSQQQEYFGPDSMQCTAGPEDVRLVVEPAGSVEGKIVPEDGAGPVPIARLFLQPDASVAFVAGMQDSLPSGADGTFRLPDVAAGNYRIHATFGTNVPPDWVAETVPVSVEAGQVTRDVKLSAMQGGLLQVTVLGKTDRKPRPQIGVNAYRQNYQAGDSSDSNGVVVLRLPPGEYQINASAQGSRQENSAATLEAGKTNRLEIEVADPMKVAGAVRGPDGKPAAGLEVRIVGGYGPEGGGVKTDADGKFEMPWDPSQFGRSDMTYCLLVRDPARNLAVAQDLDEDTGPLDLRLAPALTIAGRAECDGQPLTNATAALVFWSGNSGMHLSGMTVNTNPPGAFEIPALPLGRRYGLQVSAPGYGQKFVNTVDSDEAKRVEVDVAELKPANLKLAGQVLDADDKLVASAYVNLYGEGQPNANVRTDREGRFRFDRVCEGPARLSANARNSHGSVSAEGGDTNLVLRLGEQAMGYSGESAKKLKGTVTDPEGKPAAGVQVTVFPFSNSRWVKTGTNGAFALSYSVQPWQMQQGGDPWLVVRDLARNLAAAEILAEGVTNLDAQLKPAMTITGRVEGTDGVPLTNAEIGLWLNACRNYSQLSDQLARADARGQFEIKTVPPGPQYIVFAKAKDHGRKQQEIELESETNRVELPPFVLKVADQVVAGQVVNADDKPVSGVHVSLSGEDQPDGSVTTDSKGRFTFKVCEGEIRIFASGQNGYANTTVTHGDTNVVIQLTRSGSYESEAPRRASLKGKPLPDLASIGLAADAAPVDKPLLLCLLDAEQRPSRRVARLLAEQHAALKQQGLAVLAVQVVAASAESFREWTNSTPMPFPVVAVEEKSTANKWATSVPSLPWLVLRDAKGTVAAEGFPLDELDAKLEGLKK